jgi:hypothetical protein
MKAVQISKAGGDLQLAERVVWSRITPILGACLDQPPITYHYSLLRRASRPSGL